jgi:hypothetical protein
MMKPHFKKIISSCQETSTLDKFSLNVVPAKPIDLLRERKYQKKYFMFDHMSDFQ